VAPILSLRPEDSTPWVMPVTCRACGSALVRDEDEVVWRCENTSCPARLGKVGRNVIEQLERSRQNDLSRLIYGLGIRHVGEKAAATIARHMRSMPAVLDTPLDALQTIPEVGPVVAASVRTFADEPHNRALIA